MSVQRLALSLLIILGGLNVLVIWLAFGTGRPSNASQPIASSAQHISPASTVPIVRAVPAMPEERETDRAALQKSLDSFSAAFQKGDSKAVAAHWTAEGEYVGDDGVTVRGRTALEKAYMEFFAKNPNNSLMIEVDSIRFPSRDTAVVEGYFKLHREKKKEPIASRCSLLYVREEGKWLVAIAREWASEGLSLRELEWLIGTWEAKHNGTIINTQYEWTPNKSFIRCRFSIVRDGKALGGMQMIGKDPVAGLLRIWTFEDEGGIGEADISRDGKKWMQAARGATSDGHTLTATNILTPVDNDSFLWQSVGRTLDDEELPDLPPIKVMRVKAKP